MLVTNMNCARKSRREAMADGMIDDFRGKSCEFMALWLEGLIETFEGKLLTFL